MKTDSVLATEKFLIECVRAASENDFRSVLRSSGPLDWPLLADEMFRLFLPIYLKAKALGEDLKIPVEIEQIVQLKYLHQAAKNKKIEETIIEIAKEFDRAGIDLIFLKGAALLMTLYREDPALRPMADIDVLVRKADLSKAEALLKNMKYGEDYERLSKQFECELSRESFSKHGFHYVYFKKEIRLELHWDISLPANALILEKLFETYAKTSAKHAEIKTLSPTANIYLACTNLVKDFGVPSLFGTVPQNEKRVMFCRALAFLSEIKKMIQFYGDKILWDHLMLWVQSTQKEFEIYALLFIAKRVVGANIPAEVLMEANHNPLVSMYLLLCSRINQKNLTNIMMLYYRFCFLRHRFRRGIFYLINPGKLIQKLVRKPA